MGTNTSLPSQTGLSGPPSRNVIEMALKICRGKSENRETRREGEREREREGLRERKGTHALAALQVAA